MHLKLIRKQGKLKGRVGVARKKIWEKSIREFISLHRNGAGLRMANILGADFEVFENVFSPLYSTDTKWFAQQLIPKVSGKHLLEIGSGAGVIACLAKLNGAKSVVATDINPDAVSNINKNAASLGLDIDVRLGSLFEPIRNEERFDIIFWNHPFYCLEGNEELDALDLSVFDKEYSYLSNYLEQGKHYLSDSGSLMLGTSNVARIRRIQQIAKGYNYRMIKSSQQKVPVFQGKSRQMDLRIYTLYDARKRVR
jgi:release factor glutamine methyltransferase